VTPSRQTSILQAALQPSPDTLLWSSHCSRPSFAPLPQTGLELADFAAAVARNALPSSHCSLLWGRHRRTSRSCSWPEQPSLLSLLPSSHCSAPSRKLLPQAVSELASRRATVAAMMLPSSHARRARLRRAVAALFDLDSELHRRRSWVPSSHCSTPSLVPLPQWPPTAGIGAAVAALGVAVVTSSPKLALSCRRPFRRGTQPEAHRRCCSWRC